ncbi:MAG: hypothetical protein ABOK23_05060 [Candidatus Methanoperedens sp.]|nr:hypothetical protein [Candidatus Methanoperedens sp.]MCZ7395046.1 hypothetical protein [Candidatus Methanoperedens sp.]
MTYTPTDFSYIKAIFLKEDDAKYLLVLFTAYLNICSSEFFILRAVYRIIQHIYYLECIQSEFF